MEVVEKVKSNRRLKDSLNTSSASQDLNEQINDLETQKLVIEKRLLDYSHEPIRRPSKKHKELNSELQLINKEIRKLNKTLKKINSIKTITSELGYKHGKVTLNKTKYYW